MPSLPLPVHSYNLEPASAGRLVNCLIEAIPEGKQPARLIRAPGIVTHAEPTAGAGRGVGVHAGGLYAVVGQSLVGVSSGGTVSVIGTIAGSKPVSMASNGNELVIGSDGGTWYVYDGTLAAISDVDFLARGARCCAALDSYILYNEPGSGRFFSSDLLDATAYAALDFATAEGAPDNLVTLASNQRELILFGETTNERYWNSGATGFPFERSPGGFGELGCLGVKAVVNADNSLFFLAHDFTIRRYGTPSVRVSTHAVEERLKGYKLSSDCEAYTYTHNGHICVVFRFPAAAATWSLDLTTNEWHERQSYGYGDWRVSGIADCYGQSFVQHADTGAIGYLSSSVYTEFDAVQRVEWTYQNVYSEARRLFHSMLEVFVAAGVGLITGQGSDPQLTLEISNDGGRTWTALPSRSIGAIGEYQARVHWDRLGMGRDRVYRCSISDPVSLTVQDTVLEAS